MFGLSDTRILFYLSERKAVRYSELLDKVIESRSTLANSLRQMQDAGLLDRKVKATRPVQTEYVLTDKGRKLVQILSEMKQLLKS